MTVTTRSPELLHEPSDTEHGTALMEALLTPTPATQPAQRLLKGGSPSSGCTDRFWQQCHNHATTNDLYLLSSRFWRRASSAPLPASLRAV
eukprot:523425-Amphidinium_carterae.1